MKKARLILSASMLTVAGLAVTMVSCNKDDETCAVGYEGKNCKTLSRDKFLGSWEGSDLCDGDNYTYVMSIDSSSTNKLNVLINNPGGFGAAITTTGTITSSNVVSLSNVAISNEVSMNGTLTVNGNSLTTSYTATDDSTTIQCEGTFTKQ